jgi:hypothetical protein
VKGVIRLSLTALGLLALAVPASIVTTIALFPLWSWFERYTGIESMGHSGPADWCYLAVFLTMALAIAFFTGFAIAARSALRMTTDLYIHPAARSLPCARLTDRPAA